MRIILVGLTMRISSNHINIHVLNLVRLIKSYPLVSKIHFVIEKHVIWNVRVFQFWILLRPSSPFPHPTHIHIWKDCIVIRMKKTYDSTRIYRVLETYGHVVSPVMFSSANQQYVTHILLDNTISVIPDIPYYVIYFSQENVLKEVVK